MAGGDLEKFGDKDVGEFMEKDARKKEKKDEIKTAGKAVEVSDKGLRGKIKKESREEKEG